MTALSLVHSVRAAREGANPGGIRPPLLVLMHGVGGNEQQMAQLMPLFDPRFIVLSVRSSIALGPNAFAWFHVTFTPNGPAIDAAEAERGWSAIASFIDEAVAEYQADPGRVFVAGFSQGGIMSLAALLTSPARIAGAVCMSGRLLPEVLPKMASPDELQDKPLLIIHGAADDKLGIHFARSARDQLARTPIALTYREMPMAHTMTRESLGVVTEWLTQRLNRHQ
jgi:phospholipase/carboxylesterase